MQIKLNRGQCFLAVFILLFIGILADQLYFYATSEKIEGEVVDLDFQLFNSTSNNFVATEQMLSKYATIIPVIAFEFNGEQKYIEGPKASFEFFKKGQQVNILYQSSSGEVKINSLFTFWLPIDYLPFAIPILMITSVLAFGFLRKNQSLKLVFNKTTFSTELCVNKS